MITYRKAKELLTTGEDVFIREDGKVVPVKVLGIYADSLRVEGGHLPYDTHGEEWWLTRKGAEIGS